MFLRFALGVALAAEPISGAATSVTGPDSARITAPAAFAALVARATGGNMRVPSYSRQTKLACAVCHYGFPQLTPFGRLFKLNGYTLTGLTPIMAQKDSASRVELALSPIGPLSVMALISTTNVATPVPGTLGTTTELPQQFSLFFATGLTPNVGIFSQFTYSAPDGRFGIDNMDLRFAGRTTLGEHNLIYGLTLNNNPGVQDVWNSSPAWGYPFVSAAVAPSPAAATLIEGALGQSVLGLGAYALFGNTVYAELSGYVAAPQGAALPLDSTAQNTPKAISPYWRLGLQHEFNSSTYLMVGAFGLSAGIFPSGVTGATNQYTDIGLDTQLEQRVGGATWIGRASYIHETQTLPASTQAVPATAQNGSNTLSTYKLNLSFIPDRTHTLTVGYFGIGGSSDNLLYPSAPVGGSVNGSPASQGETFEVTANPWMNVRLGVQYTAYQKFNGGSTSYDIPAGGRSAKANNSLYVYLYLAY